MDVWEANFDDRYHNCFCSSSPGLLPTNFILEETKKQVMVISREDAFGLPPTLPENVDASTRKFNDLVFAERIIAGCGFPRIKKGSGIHQRK